MKPRMDAVCAGENTRALVPLQVEAFAYKLMERSSGKVSQPEAVAALVEQAAKSVKTSAAA